MRGPHPKDRLCFRPEAMGVLARVAEDLRYLLGRGYAQKASIKLVADRFQLLDRQRKFLMRAVVPPQRAAEIGRRAVGPEALRGSDLRIDGYNVLITVETALAGGPLIEGDDRFLRDLAGQHGSYRRCEHTERAIALIVEALGDLGVARAEFLLDEPVSRSGPLAARLRRALAEAGIPGTARAIASPDREIREAFSAGGEAPIVAATSDSILLEAVERAFDLPRWIVERATPGAWILRARA